MTRFHSMLSWLAPCVLALGGCASTAPAPAEPPLPPIRSDTIARLVVDGPNAFVNGNLVQGGSYVRDGDTVSTGERTSVKLLLNDGGEIQLDENTDPLFREGTCLLMKILRGRVAFRNMKCQEFEDGLKMAGVARSHVHILSLENESSRVTVLEGAVDMRSPSPATLGRFDEYIATAEGAVEVLRLTPQEANARVEWTRKYFVPRAAPQAGSGGLSPAGAAAIGGIIGWGLDALSGRSSRRSRPPDPPEGLQTQPQPPSDVQPQPEPQPQAEPQPEPKPEPQPQPEPQPEPQPPTQPEPPPPESTPRIFRENQTGPAAIDRREFKDKPKLEPPPEPVIN